MVLDAVAVRPCLTAEPAGRLGVTGWSQLGPAPGAGTTPAEVSEVTQHDSRGDHRPVVVGVDGSPSSRAALAFALEEGLVRGVTVEVVTTWLLGPTMADVVTASSFEEEEKRAREAQDAVLDEVLAGFDERPAISQVVLHNYSGRSLVEAAHDAALLVVGSGRKGLVSRAVLGSVSEYCVRHAHVPVVVVADPARIPEEPPAEVALSGEPVSSSPGPA